eukprot:m.181108 g.181108  ORF g.181108 m.181108 type:complete len:156 (-) comp13582_c0_seq11:994-1461(-)
MDEPARPVPSKKRLEFNSNRTERELVLPLSRRTSKVAHEHTTLCPVLKCVFDCGKSANNLKIVTDCPVFIVWSVEVNAFDSNSMTILWNTTNINDCVIEYRVFTNFVPQQQRTSTRKYLKTHCDRSGSGCNYNMLFFEKDCGSDLLCNLLATLVE